MKDKIIESAKKWKNCFNSGDHLGCSLCYESDAVMHAVPFGIFHGRENIASFWKKLIEDGFKDVDYIDPVIIESPENNMAILKSKWKMNNAKGVIVQELWVKQPDGKFLLRNDYFVVE